MYLFTAYAITMSIHLIRTKNNLLPIYNGIHTKTRLLLFTNITVLPGDITIHCVAPISPRSLRQWRGTRYSAIIVIPKSSRMSFRSIMMTVRVLRCPLLASSTARGSGYPAAVLTIRRSETFNVCMERKIALFVSYLIS